MLLKYIYKISTFAALFLLTVSSIALFPEAINAQGHPLINEVMSSNTTSLMDEDGDRPDWMEIYNPDGSQASLGGYGLSDDPDDLFKWTFPAVSIPAGGHLVIFASGKNRTDINHLHTNFKIDNTGEYLSLTAPSGTIADEVDVPALSADTSWGRTSDGNSEWQMFSPSSPDLPNGSTVQSGTVFVSHNTGFYSSPFSVTISVETPNAIIRYTLDGSEPTSASSQYVGPVSITGTKVLRARAFADQYLPGPITTATYSFESHPVTIVPEYFITCYPPDFNLIYDNYDEDIYIPVTVTVNGVIWSDVRMRIRGDDSRAYPKKSLKIRFDGEPFANGRDVLNFNAEYLDKSYLDQYLSSLVMRQAGYPVYGAEYARLYLNGEFLGLYLRIENVDEAFLEAQGMDPTGNLYKATYENSNMSLYDFPDSLWEKKTNTDSGYNDLIAFVDSINTVSDSDYERFAHEKIDYDHMVDILALNMLVANGSTYYHNYFMYHDIHGDGKWTMIPWDMDKTLGLSYGPELPYHRSSPTIRADNPFLERALLTDTIFQDIRNRVTALSQTVFTIDTMNPVIDSLKTVLSTSIAQDTIDNVSDIGKWHTAIDDRISFIEDRPGYLESQFLNLPRPFRVKRTSDFMVTNTPFIWYPATDPNGDQVRYTFSFSNRPDFTSNFVQVDSIIDTTYTLTSLPLTGTYYWRVTATDGTPAPAWYDNSYHTEGFDSWNKVTIKHEGSIPANITTDLTLSIENSPYLVTGDVTVHQGARLTIPAGVELLFMPDVGITVHGSINVFGNKDNPVVFHAASYDLENGRWNVVYIDHADGLSTFEHVVISGAAKRLNLEKPAAISTNESALVVKHVQFENNWQSIFVDGGSITVENCRFEASNLSESINIKNCDGAIVTGSHFINLSEFDAIDVDTVSNCIISNNTIVVSNDDGIDVGLASNVVRIYGNVIYDCFDKGVSVGEQSTMVTLDRNVIVGCDIGIAVKDSSTATIDHSTLYGNGTGISAYLKTDDQPGGGIATVINTIIAGSTVNAIKLDGVSQITVSYSLSDTETLAGEGNILGAPGFRSIPENDFTLAENSLAIDAGDPLSPKDPDNTRTDMGAVWYLPQYSEIVINEINYHSADTFDTGDWIELYNRAAIPVDLYGWSIGDSGGNNTVIYDNISLPAGGYLVCATNATSFSLLYPDMPIPFEFGFGINNGGETIRLYNITGALADSVAFDDEYPWPTEPDGNGPTLALMHPDDENNNPSNWQASSVHGTPGRANDYSTVVNEPDRPTEFVLEKNYPNPFNPTTTIGYQIPERSTVILTVYSITGQRINTIDMGMQDAGHHTYVFDGSVLSSGVYLYRVESGRSSKTGRMLLLR